MSALRSKAEGVGLEWIRPRGVAPERMPKAEATTGLAPKKASAVDPSVAATKSPSEGFDFEVAFDFDWPLSLVRFLRS